MKDAFSLLGAAVAALSFLCVGCGGGSTSPEATLLNQSRARWAASGVTHYAFTVRQSCFCAPESLRPIRFEVENGVVKSVTHEEDGTPADPAFFTGVDTVEDLFSTIQRALDEGSTLHAVEYDATLGYLKQAAIDWVPSAVDDEISYTISNFTQL